MSESEIIEGNKLIAQFLGLTIITDGISLFDTNYKPLAKYHESWNDLMPVVEKIESLGYCFRIESNDIFIMDNETSEELINADDNKSKIDGVWWACFRFIEWNNKNNKNKF